MQTIAYNSFGDINMLPQYLPIENNPNLARHTNSMAVVNLDKQSRIQYRIQKERILREKEDINNLRKEVDDLKNLVMELLAQKSKEK